VIFYINFQIDQSTKLDKYVQKSVLVSKAIPKFFKLPILQMYLQNFETYYIL